MVDDRYQRGLDRMMELVSTEHTNTFDHAKLVESYKALDPDLPDYYGGGTDRVLISWDLAGPPGRARAGRTVTAPATGDEAATAPADRDRLRRDLIAEFAAGGRLVGVDRQDDRAAYTFERGTP